VISTHHRFKDQSPVYRERIQPVAGCSDGRSPAEHIPSESLDSDTIACKVRMAMTGPEREEIYRLRYQVYIEEMNGAQRHDEADVAARQLRDEWDERAYHFYVSQEGMTVACARILLRRDGPLECEDQFELKEFGPAYPNHICMTSRLALHPQTRGRHLLKQLTCAMYQFACEQNIQFSFIDCHSRLLPLYTRLGFRTYRHGFNHSKYTYVIPMVLVVNDVEHLEAVKSPFAPIRRHYPDSPAGRELLKSKFPNPLSSPKVSEAEGPASMDALLERLLGYNGSGPCEMLNGLTLENAKLVASLGHIVPCKAGSAVLREGDPGREIFVILEGRFEVHGKIRSSQGEIQVSRILTEGNVFGEIRFLTDGIRYASVVAMEDSTVLILNAKAMDRLVITAPKVGAKVFRNIARIVVNRLCHTVGVAGDSDQ
jgi:predicted GNAT family N-acyltransferase